MANNQTVTSEETRKAEHRPPTCRHCGSVLSCVTWTCVRGSYCKDGSEVQRA